MKVSQLLKLMLIAALPMRAVEDDTAGAEPSSTEAGTAPMGESADSLQTSPSGCAADGQQSASASSQSLDTPASLDWQSDAGMGGGESPNVATLAAGQSASDILSSAPSASPVVDTQAAASSGETAGEQGNVGASTSLAGGATSVATDADVGESLTVTGSDTPQTAIPADTSAIGTTAATAAAGSSSSSTTTDLPLGTDAGNVLAGGAPLAGITSDSTEALDEPTDDHPAKPRLAALRRKIESGEAIIMADLLRLIHAIEETL